MIINSFRKILSLITKKDLKKITKYIIIIKDKFQLVNWLKVNRVNKQVRIPKIVMDIMNRITLDNFLRGDKIAYSTNENKIIYSVISENSLILVISAFKII